MITFANIKLLEKVAGHSRCKRRQIGAVTIDSKNKSILVGWNTMPRDDYSLCDNCPREGQEHGVWTGNQECPAIHAEEVIILDAARMGCALEGLTLLITDKPCNRCARLIYEAGFKKVIYISEIGSSEGIDYLRKCGVTVEQHKPMPDAIIKENPDEGVIE